MIKGVREDDMRRIALLRGRGYDSVRDLWLRTGLSPAVLERLASADAFCSIGLDRRDALWAVRGLNRAGDKDDLPLFAAAASSAQEPDMHLPPMPLGEHVVEDYRHLSLSLKAHPVSFLRTQLRTKKIHRCEQLALLRNRRATVAGLVLVRQRPGSSKGVIFMTLEDETGIANAIVWPTVFETFRPLVLGARFVAITGRVQNEAGVIHMIADHFEDLTPWLSQLAHTGPQISALANADELRHRQERPDKQRERADLLTLPTEAAVMPKGRNFH
jgi:error-prone DNA polymerase